MKHAFAMAILALMALTSVAHAYTGSFAVSPAIPGGPGKNTVESYDIDTRVTNPQTIIADHYYVYSVVLQLNTADTAKLLITEDASRQGGDLAFSFTVPQRIQDELVSATIYFWAPDVPSLTITHVHGSVSSPITATKVSPQVNGLNGNVLWSMTTTSFSDFYSGAQPSSSPKEFPIAPLVILALASVSACVLLRKE